MITIDHILLPIDFSECSRHALAYAAAFGRWYRSEITVLHVYSAWLPPVAVPSPSAAIPNLPTIPMSAAVTPEEIREEVRRFSEPLVAAGLSPKVMAEVGDNAVRSIVRVADEQPPDLLIMGTHGRSGFERLVLGSVTEKALRLVRCPVLTIPPPVELPEAESATFKTILCAVDFGPSSVRAFEYALSLAKEADARLILLHVIEPFGDVTALGDPAWVLPPNFRADLERESMQQLSALLPDDARSWCRPEILLASGKPHREILRVAAEADARLIVMGVRGRGPIDLLLFGSTTHHVVRSAQCPVLTLREPEQSAS